MKEAISYYGDDTDPSREKLLTHFFYASVLDIIDDDANALEQYEIAIKTGEELNEYLYTGYSYSNMASMYEEDWIGEEEMKYAEKALEKIRLTNDTTRIIDMLIQYGAVLMHNEKHAEADQIFHEGLQLFDSHLDSALLKRGQAESTVHMLNWAIRSVKFLGVEFDQSEDEEVSVSDTTHL